MHFTLGFGPVKRVSALSVDNAGNLFFAEFARVKRLSPDGGIITVAGNGTPGFSGDGGLATDAQMNPTGVAVDLGGNLFIADGPSNRIRRVSPEGVITTVAGNGACGYAADGGAATEAALCRPSGIAVDSLGTIYLADTGNSVIRVLRSLP